jgi:predicted nucleotidyltransferase
MQNLSELTQRLIESRVEFVLVGGFAAVAHGVTLVTRDVDICCRFSETNLMRIQAAFADLHPVHRSRPDMPLELTPQQCAGLKNLYLKTDLGVVDCLGEVLGIGNFEEVLKHSVEVELPYGNCRIIDLEALIRAKEAMNREHDLITVKHLKEIIKQQKQN